MCVGVCGWVYHAFAIFIKSLWHYGSFRFDRADISCICCFHEWVHSNEENEEKEQSESSFEMVWSIRQSIFSTLQFWAEALKLDEGVAQRGCEHLWRKKKFIRKACAKNTVDIYSGLICSLFFFFFKAAVNV